METIPEFKRDMPNKNLFEDNSDDEVDESLEEKLQINKSYAENYEKWRRKEDYQALKDKYGEDAVDSDSDSSSDEDFAEPDNPEFDMDFFRVLAAVHLKHPIMNEDRKFFKDSYPSTSSAKPSRSEKPVTIEDYERKVMLEMGGKYEDENDLEAGGMFRTKGEVDEIVGPESNRQKFSFDDGLSDDDDCELFTKKKKSDKKEAEEGTQKQEGTSKGNEAIEFLLGKKESLTNKLDEELLTGLKSQWHTNMSKKDKYLMDYFVNQRYLDAEDKNVERAPNHYILDMEPLEEDEKTFDRMQEYETKYRFRFEEPDQDFIRRYPRVLEDSVRKKDTKRKDLREQKKRHQEEERERREQEVKRMKAWKKKEILDRINKLKVTAGLAKEHTFEGIDLDADFDPDEHDAAMANMFGESYYNEEAEDSDAPDLQDEELNRELREEYENLDQLDNMLEGTFKYVDVFPNSYGLSTEEVLFAKDQELNRWYPLKNMHQYSRDAVTERRQLSNFRHRASFEHVKAKILPSLYVENLEEQWEAEEERKRRRNLKKKERKLKKQLVKTAQRENAAPSETTNTEIKQEVTTEVKSGAGDKAPVSVEETKAIHREGGMSRKRKHAERKGELPDSVKNRLEEPDVHQGRSNPSDETKVVKGDTIRNTNEHLKRKNRKKENPVDVDSPQLNTAPKTKVKQKWKTRHHKLKGISDNRLVAYGQDPKKVKRLLKYAQLGNK